MTYKKILVGTDGSVSATRAELTAATLARSQEADLVVFRAEGDAATALISNVEMQEADLLVVGSRGMTSSSRFLLGSVPDRVSHHSPCDLLIVKTDGNHVASHDGVYRRVLIAADGSKTSIEAARRGLDLSFELGAEPVLFYAGHPKTAEIVFDEIARPLSVDLSSTETSVLQGDAADKILESASDGGFDLIVLGNKGMSGGRFHLGSVPNKVSHHAPCDLLIVKTVSQTLSDIPEGEGGVIVIDGQKVAVFKEKERKVHIMSARCSHMGCTVAWNFDEKTWDCPCHGSRYDPKGAVVQGPAQKDLHPISKGE